MNQGSFRVRGFHRLALALAAGLALAACDREDAAGDALNNAHIKLASLSPFGTSLAAEKNRLPADTFKEHKLKAYSDIISGLKTAVDHGTPTQKASASLLIAQAQIGQTEPDAARAGETERQALDQLSAIRSALAHYVTYSASAAAAASYDASKELADIEATDKEKAAEIEKEAAAKAAVEKTVADLTGQARARSDAARAKRQEAGALHQKVVNQSATQGEQTLIESRRISREADALEVQAAQLESEAAKVAPRAGEIQNTIDRLTKQRALLAAQRTDVAQRTQSMRQQAGELKAEAAKAADEIKKLAEQTHELRQGALAEETKRAIDGYTNAAKTAGRAVAELKGTAQMIVGSAQQSLGEVQLRRAQGLRVYATQIESLALAPYPLADAGTYKSRAEEAMAGSKEATDAAFEAYKAADAAYGAAGGSAEAKARLDKLNAKFIELIKAAGGSEGLIESRGGPAPEATPSGEGTPAGATVADQSTPQGTLQMLIDIEKSGNYAASADLFLANSDAERQAIQGLVGFAPKFKRFDNAVKAKFGKSFLEVAQQAGGGAAAGMQGMGGGLEFSGIASAADVPVQIEGDTATFTLPNNTPLLMKQRDGKWLVDLGAQGPQVAMMAPMMDGLGKAFEELAADVESGKFASPEAMMMALGQKMQGLMGGMNPGGG